MSRKYKPLFFCEKNGEKAAPAASEEYHIFIFFPYNKNKFYKILYLNNFSSE